MPGCGAIARAGGMRPGRAGISLPASISCCGVCCSQPPSAILGLALPVPFRVPTRELIETSAATWGMIEADHREQRGAGNARSGSHVAARRCMTPGQRPGTARSRAKHCPLPLRRKWLHGYRFPLCAAAPAGRRNHHGRARVGVVQRFLERGIPGRRPLATTVTGGKRCIAVGALLFPAVASIMENPPGKSAYPAIPRKASYRLPQYWRHRQIPDKAWRRPCA